MATKPGVTITDGFDKPYIVPPIVEPERGSDGSDPDGDRGNTGGTEGNAAGAPEPQPKSERIAGFETASPFDIIGTGTAGDGYRSYRRDADGSGGDNQPSARRGRKPGSKNRPRETEQSAKNLIADLEALLLSVHFMGAKLLDTPEIELDESEAKKLSDSLKNVAKYYSVSLDPKKLALAELVFAAGAVYGPRGIAIFKRVNSQPKPVATVRNIDQPIATGPKPTGNMNGTPPVSFKPEVPSQMWFGGESDDIEL